MEKVTKTVYEGYWFKEHKIKKESSARRFTFWEFPWLWKEKDRSADFNKVKITVEIIQEV